ncbi:hypothetical protein DAPPUDRAFT_251412 [Daphnia pulex]|uniref:Uncharacterized protein n=1 Tax=Daphnia pulex TaxID=6669 RepID=E9H0D9_DAPPU|nr:hypothetical protein DAPPUDRAFT_251412 [Daphnia pulex]|eukprot:EFX74836.1 hypothetical protein DAPPUDRAFT_251412 [Daphnia pulex]
MSKLDIFLYSQTYEAGIRSNVIVNCSDNQDKSNLVAFEKLQSNLTNPDPSGITEVDGIPDYRPVEFDTLAADVGNILYLWTCRSSLGWDRLQPLVRRNEGSAIRTS